VIGRKSVQIRLTHGTVRESARQVIYALRVHNAVLDFHEIDDIAARMRDRLAHRGEGSADVVVVQGGGKNSLRLFGTPYSVSKVRAAMFNAAINWTPIEFD
jgi:2-methylcitrate dehydratase PrpD